jgi:hypothetical protein
LISLQAEPTAPVDLSLRNAPFAPAAGIAPEKKSPAIDDAVQDKRVDKTVVEKTPAAVGDRRAAIDVQEARDKNVREKDSHRPEAVAQPMNAFNHREATLATTTDAKKPETIARYQDGLKAASTANMARFPALGGATTAKINRFVFRKNAPAPSPITGDAPVVPAAGGEKILK